MLVAVCASARQLPVRVLSMAEGLPRNAVACIVPGPAGMMWLCTSEGLAQYDGYQFRTFGPEHGLPSRVAIHLVPSKAGGYWLVTDRGVCRLYPSARIGEPCPLLSVDVLEGEFGFVFESRRGAVWVATTRALYTVSADGRRLLRTGFQLPAHEEIQSLADGASGAVLVGTDTALYEWTRAGRRTLSPPAAGIGIRDMQRAPSGDLLLATSRGLCAMQTDGAAFRRIDIPRMNVAHQLLHRHSGAIWVSGDAGICRLAFGERGEIGAAECLDEHDGLPFNILFLTEDEQGDIWGTTESAGIFRLADTGAVLYQNSDELGDARVASIFEDRLGRLCAMTGENGVPALRIRNGDSFVRAAIPLPEGIRPESRSLNQIVLQDRDRSWWLATSSGVLRFPSSARAEDLVRSGAPTLYGVNSPAACSEALVLFEDSDGAVWTSCGGEHGTLARWQRNSWRVWRAGDGWPADAEANVIREASPGVLWLGTNDSAVRFRNSRFDVFPLNLGPRPPIVRDLLVDRKGSLWVATQREGLLRCDNPNDARPVFHAYTVRDGMSSNSVRSLVEDEDGFIYAGTVRGVDRIDPAAPFDGEHIRHLTSADGLPDGDHTCAFRDSRGHLWFGTLRGLAEFEPAKTVMASHPDVRLTGLRVRGQDVALPWEGAASMSLDLAANRNQVEIEYTSVDLRSVASLRYQYRLEGVDSRWSAPSTQRVVNLATLPPGRMRFEVRAIGPDGQPGAPATLDLRLEAALWRRWWFLAGLALMVAGVATAAHRRRVHHLLAIERLRTSIATDLHDDIGASLTQISILSELARRGAAPQVLSEIAGMARGVVEEMSDIVWAVNPRHDHADALAHRMRRFASDTLGGADIDARFDTHRLPPESIIPLEARRPLYLVFKEAVNNVARHSGAEHAAIRLELAHGALALTVEDDGRGFETEKTYTGEGLISIARRMKSLGGTARWECNNGGGTRFTATLPLHSGTFRAPWLRLWRGWNGRQTK